MNNIRTMWAMSSLLLLSTMQAQAGTMGPVGPVSDWRWVGTLSAGPAWATAGETQTFFLTPAIEKTYAAEKTSKVLGSGELFLGGQKALNNSWLGQLGLALGLAGDAQAQGIIWDDANPEFNNLSYAYKIRHGRVAVKGKLLHDSGSWFTPWVSGSLGVGFNRAHDFTNTPLRFEAVPNSNFANKTKTAFTYTVGAGVQKTINEHWQLGVGYEFADWGHSELGRAFGQSLNSGLQLDHLYTNGVLLNITYLS